METDEAAIVKSKQTHAINRACEHLMGMVTGIVADGQLHDLEVKLLQTWITENSLVTRTWPGSLLQRQVAAVLEDGVVSEAERRHLMSVLSELASTDFSITGSSSPEVVALPINDAVTVSLRNAGVCLTGEFLYGTRAACERATMKAGGTCADNPSRHVDYLVIGTRVSPSWAHTSFGRKIQKAVGLQESGHPIEIISERRWIEVLV